MSDNEKIHHVSAADVIEEFASDLISTITGEDEPLAVSDSSDDDEDLMWGQRKDAEPGDSGGDTGGPVEGSWTQDSDGDADKATLYSRAETDVDNNSWEEPSTSAEETTQIKHSFELSASPQEVYDTYMDDDAHTQLTGKPAQLERYVGGHMEVLDGEVIGDFVELDDGSRIVQTWRSSTWPEGAEVSRLTLTFEPTDDGAGTKLTMLLEDVPADQVDGSRDLFAEYYWEPLMRRFG